MRSMVGSRSVVDRIAAGAGGAEDKSVGCAAESGVTLVKQIPVGVGVGGAENESVGCAAESGGHTRDKSYG